MADKLQKSRAGLISVISKAFTSIENWKTSTSVPELKGRILSLEGTLQNFRTVTNQLLEITDETEVEDYFNENSEKESIAQIVIETLKERVDKLQPPQALASNVHSVARTSQSNSVEPSIKLDVLKMNKFDGTPIHFQAFWDRWNARYHTNPNISDVDRFEYLLQHLEGKALSAVSGLPPTANNYNYAIDIIKKRFGRRTPLIMSHIMTVLDLPRGGEELSIDQLRKTLDVITHNVRALQAMGLMHTRSGDVNAVLGSIIFSRFPDSVCDRWCDNHMSDDVIHVDSFLQFVEDFVSGREFSRLSRGSEKQTKGKEKSSSQHQQHTTLTAYNTNVQTNEYSNSKSFQKPNSSPKSQRSRTTPRSNPNSQSRFSKSPTKPNSKKEQSKAGQNPGTSHSFSLLPGPSYSTQPSSDSRPPCPFCGNHHYIGRCEKARALPPGKVISMLESSQRCLCCFNFGHKVQNCNFKPVCALCSGFHLPLVCSKRLVAQSAISTAGMHCSSEENSQGRILLKTARVMIEGPNGSMIIRCMLDDCSQASLIRKDLAKRLGIQPFSNPLVSVEPVGAKFVPPSPKPKYSICLRSLKDASVALQMDVLGIPLITPRPHTFLSSNEIQSFEHLQDLDFSDDSSDEQPIQVLIGADYYYAVVGYDRRDGGPNSPTAMSSKFGWVLGGPTSNLRSEGVSVSTHLLGANIDSKSSDQMMAEFFSIESYGMEDSSDESPISVLQSFNKTIRDLGNRYQVSLPWKEDHPPLLSTEIQANRRFSSLLNRLNSNPTLFQMYKEVMEEYKIRHFIEQVPVSELNRTSNPVYYLPHRPVIRESSKTTKVRPVFDASCKGPSGISLNNCLETGPSLNPEIPDILLRFRNSPIIVSSDIEKAFLQLTLSPNDRDVCRFFWIDKDGNTVVYRFRVVSFGIVSSPFLLRATISHHLSRQQSSETVAEMEKNFYVDNVCQGASSVSEAMHKATMAKKIMQQAGMNLTQWATNSSSLKGQLDSLGFDVDSENQAKFLGILWDTENDMIRIRNVQISDEVVLTKRAVLQAIARVYDPLGFFSPIVVQGKLCLQQLWILKQDWDEPINDPSILQSISKLFTEISKLESFPIPRFPFLGGNSTKTIHVFCDSSSVASAVCVYLVEHSGSRCASNLMLSKTKVVPLRVPEGREEDLRIPRKELVACLMGAKVGERIATAVSLPHSCLHFWTDSSICIAWINSPKEKTQIYVKNRVNKIRRLTSSSWRHVPTHENPADIPSRGQISLEKLVQSSLWKHGPPWLTADQEYWPSLENTSSVETLVASVTVEEAVQKSENVQSLIPLFRFSSLLRAQRATAWTLRALKVWVPEPRGLIHETLQAIDGNEFSKESPIPRPELDNALHFLIRDEQKRFFKEEFQALSQGHQLSKSSSLLSLRPTWDASRSIIVSVGREQPKVPLILLPKQSDISRLVLLEYHVNSFHGGTEITLGKSREQYWIINGRVITKQIIHSCPTCKFFSSHPYMQKESALPLIRTTPAPPFQRSGIDFAGPFYLQDNMKVSILLFTCAVTRGIHLEVVPDLSFQSFSNAIRRFQARRTNPKVIFSDNALTFRRAARQFPTIDWRFNPEKSPWWGGFYERLVKSVKTALRKVLGKSQVSFTSFQTLIIEIEDMINNRPLTIVGDDVDSPQPLTPNHFLKPSMDIGELKPEFLESDDLKKIWNNRNRILQHFWKRWRTEYLTSLRLWRQKRITGTIVPSIGDVVLLEVEGRSRVHWPLGIIHSLIKGVDGHVRAAVVRLAKVNRNAPGMPATVSLLRRPTRQLYPLETSLTGESVEEIISQRGKGNLSMPSENCERDQKMEESASKVVSRTSRCARPRKVISPGPVPFVTRTGRQVLPPKSLQDFHV